MADTPILPAQPHPDPLLARYYDLQRLERALSTLEVAETLKKQPTTPGLVLGLGDLLDTLLADTAGFRVGRTVVSTQIGNLRARIEHERKDLTSAACQAMGLGREYMKDGIPAPLHQWLDGDLEGITAEVLTLYEAWRISNGAEWTWVENAPWRKF